MKPDSTKFETARNTICHHDNSKGIEAVLGEKALRSDYPGLTLYLRTRFTLGI
jgi:hypothetical protein